MFSVLQIHECGGKLACLLYFNQNISNICRFPKRSKFRTKTRPVCSGCIAQTYDGSNLAMRLAENKRFNRNHTFLKPHVWTPAQPRSRHASCNLSSFQTLRSPTNGHACMHLLTSCLAHTALFRCCGFQTHTDIYFCCICCIDPHTQQAATLSDSFPPHSAAVLHLFLLQHSDLFLGCLFT